MPTQTVTSFCARNGSAVRFATPSQTHWEDCQRAQLDDGEVSRG